MNEDLAEKAKQVAEKKGISLSGLIRMFLIEGLDRLEEEQKSKK